MTPSIANTGMDILEVCRRMKQECADLYHYYADLFAYDRQYVLIWKRLALEYENHAKNYPLMAKFRRQEPLGTFNVDILDAEITLIFVESLRRRMEQSSPSLEEAIASAVSLEQKLSMFHLYNILSFNDESHAAFFTAMTKPQNDALLSLKTAHTLFAEKKQVPPPLPARSVKPHPSAFKGQTLSH